MTSSFNLDCNPLYRDLGCPAQCSANYEYAILSEYSKFDLPKSSILSYKLELEKQNKENTKYGMPRAGINSIKTTFKIPNTIIYR